MNRAIRELLPLKDQTVPRLVELCDVMDDTAQNIAFQAERKIPNYNAFSMENDPIHGVRDLKNLASILGVEVRQRFGQGYNTDDPVEQLARERAVYRRAIETAVAYYKIKGTPPTISIIGYILGLIMTGYELNTTSPKVDLQGYKTFYRDADVPVGWYSKVDAEDTLLIGDGVNTTFIFNVAHPPIIPTSVSVWENGTDQIVIDDGDGVIIGNGTGTVSYSTGVVAATFIAPPPPGAIVRINYKSQEENFGFYYFRSPHFEIEVDWIGSLLNFQFDLNYASTTLLDDLQVALEDIRPAHVTFRMAFVIGLRKVININSTWLIDFRVCIPDGPDGDWDWTDLDNFCYQFDANSYVQLAGQNTRYDIYIAGVKVADISHSGIRFTGSATTELGALTNPVADWVGDAFYYDSGTQIMYLGYWFSGSGATKTWRAFMSFDSAGEFETLAELVERDHDNLIQDAPECESVVDESGAADETVVLGLEAPYLSLLAYRNLPDQQLSLYGEIIEGTVVT